MMRIVFTCLMLWLLTSCAANHYDQTVASWNGRQSTDLIARWGQPSQLITQPDGSAEYIYTTQSVHAFPYPNNQQFVAVVNKNGTTLGAALPGSTDPSIAVMHCTTSFYVNNHHIITGSQFTGGDCFANETDARHKMAAEPSS